NSPTNAAAFQSFGKAITVIPNGAEPRPESIEPVELPGPRLKSPLLGYVGNMRDRVDWKLIEGIAKQRPDWQIVLVGEAPPHIEAHGVAQRCENVRLTGILPYDQARSLMTTFDVGIIPHVLSDQSTRMDPLKLYNMVAMGIPVVSTAHPTAIGMSDHVAIGHDVGSFIDRIKDALAAERPDPAAIDISDFAWSTRVKTMFSLIDGLPEALSCRSEAP
ncbi:MAG: glycosyltransferase, partial [Acidimicrobiales bacterium]|nr:glycosyltransferase [Acidimicrobiales bacterium]